MKNEMFRLKQMMKQVEQAKVLAIASGKGGVGKSNVAAHLAICLAAAQRKVLLVDADVSLGNLDVIMNINSKYNISHVLSGKKKMEEIIQIGPAGLSIICGVSGIEELANLNEFHRARLLTELGRLQKNYDQMIIDTAAGISKSVIGFCLASDQVLVVTTPEATAMTDAYAMIKVLTLNNYKGQINLLVNMADNLLQARKTYMQISNVAARFLKTDVYDAGVLLRDAKLTAAVRARVPVTIAFPKAKITSSFMRLAARLDNSLESANCQEGFFRKVVDWIF